MRQSLGLSRAAAEALDSPVLIGAVVNDSSVNARPVWRNRVRLPALQLLLFLVVMAVWQLAATTFKAQFWVSTPQDIGARLIEWVFTGYLFFHLAITMQEAILGFVIGGGLAIGFGLVLGLTPFISRLIDPFIIGLYSLPKIALAPLFVLWFGIGINSKIALAAISVFFLVLFNTLAGVRDVDRELIDVIRIMRGSRLQILREVVLPSALVWVFSGLRVSVPYALIGAVTGEIITSNRGVGYLVSRSAGLFDASGVFAALVALVLFSAVLYGVVVHVESRLLAWKSAGQRNS